MIPNKAQWKKWSLPSKYSAIGIVIGILSLIPLLIPVISYQNNITATEYAKNTHWYLDAKLTAKNMPDKFKEFMSEDDFIRSRLQKMAKDSYGISSEEYKTASLISNDSNSIAEAFFRLSKTRLVITDKNITFITGTNVKEWHNEATPNANNYKCYGSSVEYKSVSAEIYRVTKNGIEFKIPSQSFTEYSGCNSSTVLVDYLPATARLQGKTLIVTHIEGIRMVEEKNGVKTIVRKDAKFFFNLKPENQAN
jgi:hypothetical protein